MTERNEAREKPCSEHVTRNTLSSFSSVRSKQFYTTSLVSTQCSQLWMRALLFFALLCLIYTRGEQVIRACGQQTPVAHQKRHSAGWSRFERSHGSSASSPAARRLDPSSRAPHAHTLGRRFEGRAGNSFEADALITATPHSAFAWSTCCQSSSLHRVSGKASTEAPGWTAAATAATPTRQAAFGTGRRCR